MSKGLNDFIHDLVFIIQYYDDLDLIESQLKGLGYSTEAPISFAEVTGSLVELILCNLTWSSLQSLSLE